MEEPGSKSLRFGTGTLSLLISGLEAKAHTGGGEGADGEETVGAEPVTAPLSAAAGAARSTT